MEPFVTLIRFASGDGSPPTTKSPAQILDELIDQQGGSIECAHAVEDGIYVVANFQNNQKALACWTTARLRYGWETTTKPSTSLDVQERVFTAVRERLPAVVR